MFHQTLFCFGFSVALMVPFIASPFNEEHFSHRSSFPAQSLPTEWYEKPPEGCDPADPSTCRREDRQEGDNRNKPEREPNAH